MRDSFSRRLKAEHQRMPVERAGVQALAAKHRYRSARIILVIFSRRLKAVHQRMPSTVVELAGVQAVAAILVAIDRSGQSIMIQIQRALADPDFKSSWIFSSYQIQLIESMLVECIEDPRPLMRSVLGKDHPLIWEVEKNAARPPPETDDEAANA